jgi:hypothetical protein
MQALAKGYFWRNAWTSTCAPKVRSDHPAGRRSLHERSPVLNLCNQILIWDSPYASSPSVLINSWWIFSIPILSVRKTWRQIFAPLSPSIVTNGFRKLSELIKVCLIPWFSFGKSVITVYLLELCLILLENRIPVRNRAYQDGRGPQPLLAPCMMAVSYSSVKKCNKPVTNVLVCTSYEKWEREWNQTSLNVSAQEERINYQRVQII